MSAAPEPHDRLTLEAARDGGYWVVGRDKTVLFAGDLPAATAYVARSIRQPQRVGATPSEIPDFSPRRTLSGGPLTRWGA